MPWIALGYSAWQLLARRSGPSDDFVSVPAAVHSLRGRSPVQQSLTVGRGPVAHRHGIHIPARDAPDQTLRIQTIAHVAARGCRVRPERVEELQAFEIFIAGRTRRVTRLEPREFVGEFEWLRTAHGV